MASKWHGAIVFIHSMALKAAMSRPEVSAALLPCGDVFRLTFLAHARPTRRLLALQHASRHWNEFCQFVRDAHVADMLRLHLDSLMANEEFPLILHWQFDFAYLYLLLWDYDLDPPTPLWDDHSVNAMR